MIPISTKNKLKENSPSIKIKSSNNLPSLPLLKIKIALRSYKASKEMMNKILELYPNIKISSTRKDYPEFQAKNSRTSKRYTELTKHLSRG